MATLIDHYIDHPEAFRQVVQAAMGGDASRLPEIRALLDAAPAWAAALGDLTQQAETKLLDMLAGHNLLQRKATTRTLAAHKQRLTEPSYVETLLLEQIALDWLALQCARKRAHERSDPQSDKLLTGAHRRFLASLKCLEQLRKLTPPIHIQIAENQVNVG